MRVELRVEARNDLIESAAFYESQRLGLGDYFIDCLFLDLRSLEYEAGIHQVVFGLHRKLASRFPFAIYQVSESIADVVAILDCRRDPNTITQRLRRIEP
jgi:hypothetical protein